MGPPPEIRQRSRGLSPQLGPISSLVVLWVFFRSFSSRDTPAFSLSPQLGPISSLVILWVFFRSSSSRDTPAFSRSLSTTWSHLVLGRPLGRLPIIILQRYASVVSLHNLVPSRPWSSSGYS